MCGIVGLRAPDVNRANLERANRELLHRGPDEGGVYLGPGIGLGARRLSIIDLAGGHQPLSNETGTVWITYNGEVFNAPQLRAELEGCGHRFRTHSDTETIVHGYEEWGDEVVTRLRGMFAFGLWDARRERLLLARDRLAIKPLYYAEDRGRVAFASEIRPLFTLLPGLTRRANPESLTHLFTLGYIPTPLTPFAHVYKLPAAHLLVAEKGQVVVKRYWELVFSEQGRVDSKQGTVNNGQSPVTSLSVSQSLSLPSPVSRLLSIPFPDAVAQFRDHLREAVAAWRMSDVPVGSLLSGGIDSSALALLLTEISGGPIHTFNIGFAAASHDESAHARDFARHIGSEHHELFFDDRAFDHLPTVIRHMESPQTSATSIPIYLLYKACREAGFKVILTGEGADELLGGYHWFDGDRRLRPLLGWPGPVRRLLAKIPGAMSAAASRLLTHAPQDPVERYFLWHQLTTPAQREELLAGQLVSMSAGQHVSHDQSPVSSLQSLNLSVSQSLGHLSPLHQFLALEAQTRMADFINDEVDRMSMANSIEARPPFLDHLLWEWCATQPPEYKLSRQGNKLLLREAMKDKMPPAVSGRAKKGLATPHALWWRREKLPAWAEECLHPTALAQTGIFSPAIVQNLRVAHQSGQADHSRLLMGVLTTQLWFQEMELTPITSR
ncbi:MAG: asparagine synthase (glutamine-hydrolyzing) [Chloroflexi bacterium]|nr:asparagine synthase (glutamine-hydrolyzing) [Chloroflexota bacterium]